MLRWSRAMTPACSLLLALAAASPAAQARPPADPAPSPGPAPAPSPAPGTEQAPSASPSPAPAPPSPPAASAPEGPAREEGGGAEAAAPAQEGPAAPPEAEKQVIGQVVVDGNVRVSDSAFFNSLKLKSGDPYDERAIQDEYRRLWDLDLFDDIVVESRRRDARTVDLIFHVRDRPLINNVAFVGMKAVTETNIQERLVQAKCEVRRGEPVDFSVLRRAEAAIEQLLAEKGYLQARCRARLTAINPSQREVTFDVLIPKDSQLPGTGEPPLIVTRSYRAAHNLGHFRFVECARVESGRPEGNLALWDEVLFPFDAGLRGRDLARVAVARLPSEGPRIEETVRCGADGELEVELKNLDDGYHSSVRIGRRGVA